MKVISAKAMANLENLAYVQGFKDHDFMENAGRGIALAAEEFIQTHSLFPHVWLLCGKGNNGGDAFVAGCYLLERGIEVTAIQPENIDHCTPLCRKNHNRFLEKKGKITQQTDSFGSQGIILDGFFGTGFKGKVTAPYASIIEKANKSNLPILAIDIPSGLDGTTGSVEGSVIHATQTLFLALPKTGFFLEGGWNQVGQLKKIDFGLPSQMIDQTDGDFELITQNKAAERLPPIIRNRHKYQAGYVIGMAGSLTMPGAALLSTLAALRGGAGMVRLLYPEGGEGELAASPYELIKIPYSYEKWEGVVSILNHAGACFVGPGMGREENTRKLLEKVIPLIEKPSIIDADALIFFGEQGFKLPSQTILTPHTGEMQALLKSEEHLVRNLRLVRITQKCMG